MAAFVVVALAIPHRLRASSQPPGHVFSHAGAVWFEQSQRKDHCVISIVGEHCRRSRAKDETLTLSARKREKRKWVGPRKRERRKV